LSRQAGGEMRVRQKWKFVVRPKEASYYFLTTNY
jgi:hypothetical protein